MNTHFMMNLFNKEKQSTKNSETSRPIPKSASVSKEAPSEFVTINIYENPSIQSIKSNISIKQSKMFLNYYDIGFMASITENLLILSPPIKDLLHYNEKAAKAKHESDSVVFQDNFQKNIKASKKLDKKVNARQQLFDNIYKVYPDFCHNMEEKVGSSKYNLYLREKTKLKRLLLQGKNYSGNELYSQALLNYQDNVSTVIDTPEFSEACSVEDQFLISELDTFFKILSELPKEEQKNFIEKNKNWK